MRIVPHGCKILVKQIAVANKTEGGLYVPDAEDQEMTVKGIVLAVGPGRVSENGTLVPNRNEVNTVVMFNRHAAVPVKDGADKYVLINDMDTLAHWTGEIPEE